MRIQRDCVKDSLIKNEDEKSKAHMEQDGFNNERQKKQTDGAPPLPSQNRDIVYVNKKKKFINI